MHSRMIPVQPLDVLKWEHSRMLAGLDELLAISSAHGDGPMGIIVGRGIRTLRFLELHQEAEERFLFPLVPELGDEIFGRLRLEHGHLFEISGLLESALNSGELHLIPRHLEALRRSLESHFETEEEHVLGKAAELLSPAQTDILRIKFATRGVMSL